MHIHGTNCQVATHYPKFQSHHPKAYTSTIKLYLDQQDHQHRKSNNNTIKKTISPRSTKQTQIPTNKCTIHLTLVQRDWSLDSTPEVQILSEAALQSHIVNYRECQSLATRVTSTKICMDIKEAPNNQVASISLNVIPHTLVKQLGLFPRCRTFM